MKIKKGKLIEIINSDNGLIGDNDTPTNGSDLESQSNNTTDHNAGIGTQPFRYDMMARFGFGLLPFYEGENNNSEQNELINELLDILLNNEINLMKYYYKNPNKLKSDYRKISDNINNIDNNKKKNIMELLSKIISLIKKYDNNFSKLKNSTIDEIKVIEDKVIEDKKNVEFSDKSEDNEITDKKLKKIAGLINKLKKPDINKLANLLEIK